MKNKYQVTGVSASVLCLTSLICAAQGGHFLEQQVSKHLEELQNQESEVVFYGLVIDQDLQPVKGAVVQVNVPERIGPFGQINRIFDVRTDSAGRFEISKQVAGVHKLKSWILIIRSLTNDGYEYLKGVDELGFSFNRDYTDFHVANQNKPVVFHMRKIGKDPAFLVQEQDLEMQVKSADSAITLVYDFIQGKRMICPTKVAGEEDMVFGDLSLLATLNTNSVIWTITLSALGEGGGILITNQMLYEAPIDGYQSNCSFVSELLQTKLQRYAVPKLNRYNIA